jgi:hypothetical protein
MYWLTTGGMYREIQPLYIRWNRLPYLSSRPRPKLELFIIFEASAVSGPRIFVGAANIFSGRLHVDVNLSPTRSKFTPWRFLRARSFGVCTTIQYLHSIAEFAGVPAPPSATSTVRTQITCRHPRHYISGVDQIEPCSR